MKIGATFLLNRICIPILCIVVCLAASACGNRNLKFPEEIDMGHTGMSGHEGHASSTVSTGSERSCEKMVEAKSDGPTRTFELTAAKTSANVPGGKTTKAWTFNGSTPGPELRVREGDRVVVKLSNQDIGKGVTIHWHGVVLPCSQDGVAGVTQDAVMPGEQFTYDFVAKHPGTYWYHSHQQSSEQASMGLIGRLIVEPKSTTFRYDRDYAVTLQKLNDKHYLTNGRADGLTLEAKPGETVRLRLINAYNEVQWMGVAGADFRVISMDGQDLNGPGALNGEWIPIGGGQRYDLLITIPENGQVQVYSKERKEWNIALGQGRVPEKLDKDAKEFDFTSYGTPKEDGITPQMKFDRSYNLELGLLDINGRQFHEIPPLVVKEGDWVKVRFEHTFGGPHPMHLHGHIFKVLTKNGKALSGSPIYADSILLFRGDVYEIAFRADNPGLWMEHCHNLGHAANGMTMMVNYEGVTTPFRVGTKSGNLPD